MDEIEQQYFDQLEENWYLEGQRKHYENIVFRKMEEDYYKQQEEAHRAEQNNEKEGEE